MRTRVALAEDHDLVRQRLRGVLAGEPRLEVIGESGDGRAALRQAMELAPDVVVMDIRMPLLNGIDATRLIRATVERVQVLVLSLHCDADVARRALAAGATGIMLKEEAHGLAQAALLVGLGATYLSPKVTAMLRATDDAVIVDPGECDGRTPHWQLQSQSQPACLSQDERAVLHLLACGASGDDVACRLGLDATTLAGHRHRILLKLSPHRNAELVRLVQGNDSAVSLAALRGFPPEVPGFSG